jgi:hypothetical protein
LVQNTRDRFDVFTFVFQQPERSQNMPIDPDSPLIELVRQTKRYSLCEVARGQFEVIDNRYLLDHLLRFPELRPTTKDFIEGDIDSLLEPLSSGPTLSTADNAMRQWLESSIIVVDPKGENPAYAVVYEGAVVFCGPLDQVEYFLLQALNHWVQ